MDTVSLHMLNLHITYCKLGPRMTNAGAIVTQTLITFVALSQEAIEHIERQKVSASLAK